MLQQLNSSFDEELLCGNGLWTRDETRADGAELLLRRLILGTQ